MTDKDRAEKRHLRRQWFMNGYVFLALLVVLICYKFVPVEVGAPVSTTSVVLFAIGIVLFSGAVLTMALRQERGTSSATTRVQVYALVGLLVGAILFFALSYYRLAQSPGEMDGLVTGIDAVYFTVSTTSTVGFGDIHASGQVARIEVIIQIVFSLIVLAGGARLLTALLRAKALEATTGTKS